MKSKKVISMILSVVAAFSLCIPTIAASDPESQTAMEDSSIMPDISAEPSHLIDETMANNGIKTDMAPMTTITSDDASYVMTGESGTTLLVDSISSQDYRDLLNVLYPDGVIDEQGQDIPGIENATDTRAKFIANHMRAYSVVDGETTEVNLTPFEIAITDQTNGEHYELLYKAEIGSDSFVFPSEWGNQSFGFTHLSNKNIYLAFTDMGIWRIFPENLSTEKLTSDTYLGDTRAMVASEIADLNPDGYLIWVDNVFISPDGNAVIYRTNRDCTVMDETSIWKIDLNTEEESQLVSPAFNNDIVGFITGSDAVIGALEDTQIVDIVNATSVSVNIPDMPNCCVNSVKDGKIIFSYRGDDSSNSTACISNVDTLTGDVNEIAEVSGYLDGEPTFSPSGNKVALGYGDDPTSGINDVVIVDLSADSQTFLTDLMPYTRSSAPDINRCLWIDEETVVVDTCPAPIDEPVTYASAYSVVFGDVPPSVVAFNSPLSSSSTSGFVYVNSKWNQPRSTGTNPHNGVDLQASINTSVYAPYAGWLTGINVVGSYDIEFLVDANNNKQKDDGDYRIRFYHMNAREADGYKAKGALIGKSGNQGGVPAHLHFGVCSTSNGLRWLRNEVNYRHLSSTNWNSGKDLDAYALVQWNNGSIASFTAYIRDDGVKRDFSEVRMYYRTGTSGAWTDGGKISKTGDVYSYDFSQVVPRGTTVQWMIRMTRSGVSQTAFGPAKYYQPNNNPNASSYPYGYWTNTVY